MSPKARRKRHRRIQKGEEPISAARRGEPIPCIMLNLWSDKPNSSIAGFTFSLKGTCARALPHGAHITLVDLDVDPSASVLQSTPIESSEVTMVLDVPLQCPDIMSGAEKRHFVFKIVVPGGCKNGWGTANTIGINLTDIIPSGDSPDQQLTAPLPMRGPLYHLADGSVLNVVTHSKRRRTFTGHLR